MYNKCIECPFHKVISDPDPYDAWNNDDEAILCTKMEKIPDITSKDKISRQKFEPVDFALRPYQTKNILVPDWCPISISKKRDDKLKDLLD